MTKEEYSNKLTELESQIGQIRAEISELKYKYIQANKMFEKGDKVRVIHGSNPVLYGFVGDHEIHWDGAVRPVIFKMKKDGTESMQKLFAWTTDIIEKSE